MEKMNAFNKFLAIQKSNVSLDDFLVGLILTAFLAHLLCLLYVKFGKSLSNRASLGSHFVLIAVTTMIIITIVKSSLALSLGLVGALSIVRFRTAIKEPEELAFLFFTIALGLGFGANQKAVTLFGFVVVAALIVSKSLFFNKKDTHNLFLNIQSDSNQNDLLNSVVDLVSKNTSQSRLKRFDQMEKNFDVSFYVELQDSKKLHTLREELLKLDSQLKFSFIDNSEWV